MTEGCVYVALKFHKEGFYLSFANFGNMCDIHAPFFFPQSFLIIRFASTVINKIFIDSEKFNRICAILYPKLFNVENFTVHSSELEENSARS